MRWGRGKPKAIVYYVIALLNSDGDASFYWRNTGHWVSFTNAATLYESRSKAEAQAYQLWQSDRQVGVLEMDSTGVVLRIMTFES